MTKKKSTTLPTESEIEKYEMLEKLLQSVYNEMKEFSKKKPDELLNKFKVKNVNRVLSQIKEILKNEPTFEFLDELDEETLPSNSDTILVLGQFKASMQEFNSRYYYWDGYEHKWSTKENPRKEY